MGVPGAMGGEGSLLRTEGNSSKELVGAFLGHWLPGVTVLEH